MCVLSTNHNDICSLTIINDQARPEITFYLFGERVTHKFPYMQTIGWTLLDQNVKDLIPTTYEASKAYLEAQHLKPEGERDMHREMCMIFALAIPDDQDLLLVIESTSNVDMLKVSIPFKLRESHCFEILPAAAQAFANFYEH